MRIVYFAYLREKAGFAETEVSPPPSVKDVRGLIEWLRTQDEGHARALADMTHVRVAVNQSHAALDQPVGAGDEVALFPPVTGG